MLVRNVLKWTDKKISEIDVENNKHPYLKVFGYGAIEGFIDAAVIMYVPVTIGAYYWRKKATGK